MGPNLRQKIHNAWQNMVNHDQLGLIVKRLEKHHKSGKRITYEQKVEVDKIRAEHLKAKESIEKEYNDITEKYEQRMKDVNILFARQELDIYEKK